MTSQIKGLEKPKKGNTKSEGEGLGLMAIRS